eukprot:2693489-Rhodomonas_salina.1
MRHHDADSSISGMTSLKVEGSRRRDKIRQLENLSMVPSLTELHLGGHVIEDMSPVSYLSRLQELVLSKNRILRIEGLDLLHNLRSVDLSHNAIKHIPKLAKLRQLHTLKLAHNKVESLAEILNLRQLPNLSALTLQGNPVTEQLHTRSYTIYHLRVLDHLDGAAVEMEERKVAEDRFRRGAERAPLLSLLQAPAHAPAISPTLFLRVTLLLSDARGVDADDVDALEQALRECEGEKKAALLAAEDKANTIADLSSTIAGLQNQVASLQSAVGQRETELQAMELMLQRKTKEGLDKERLIYRPDSSTLDPRP